LQRAFGRLGIASIAVAGLLAAAPATSAADLPSPFSGNLFGIVVDALGTPQIGAPVQLYDRYHHALRKTFTSSNGRFGFGGLSPSHYSIRVSVTSFLPATRRPGKGRGWAMLGEVRWCSIVPRPPQRERLDIMPPAAQLAMKIGVRLNDRAGAGEVRLTHHGATSPMARRTPAALSTTDCCPRTG